MNDFIDIVFSASDSHVPHVGVAILSLLKNSSHKKFKFTILSTKVSPRNKFFLNLVIKENSRNSVVDFVDVTSMIGTPLLSNGWTKEIYYRFFTPRVLSDVNKALYLDCDVLVLDDIVELFEKDLGSHSIAAAREIYSGKVKDIHTKEVISFGDYMRDWLNLSDECNGKYFNSGVLLMNLDVMRSDNTPEKMIEKAHEKYFLYPDQDILNIFYVGDYLELKKRWNFPAWTYRGGNIDVKILHFNGKGKPWIYGPPLLEYGFSPFGNDLYFRYLRETPWMEQVVHGVDKKKLFDIIKELLENKKQ